MTPSERELFIQDEMIQDILAGGDPFTSRAHAERFFEREYGQDWEDKSIDDARSYGITD